MIQIIYLVFIYNFAYNFKGTDFRTYFYFLKLGSKVPQGWQKADNNQVKEKIKMIQTGKEEVKLNR
jgi:hypothetical protein